MNHNFFVCIIKGYRNNGNLQSLGNVIISRTKFFYFLSRTLRCKGNPKLLVRIKHFSERLYRSLFPDRSIGAPPRLLKNQPVKGVNNSFFPTKLMDSPEMLRTNKPKKNLPNWCVEPLRQYTWEGLENDPASPTLEA